MVVLIKRKYRHRHYCGDCNKTRNCDKRGCEDIPVKRCTPCIRKEEYHGK